MSNNKTKMPNIKIVRRQTSTIDNKTVLVISDAEKNTYYKFEDDSTFYCFAPKRRGEGTVCGTGLSLENSLMNTRKESRLPDNIMSI